MHGDRDSILDGRLVELIALTLVRQHMNVE
jgi:hypothetical protein